MDYKVVELILKDGIDPMTEIAYNVVSARADGIELLRFNLINGEDVEKNPQRRVWSAIKRALGGLKQKNLIQFFALQKDFESNSTEASFLINKYQRLLEEDLALGGGASFIYVKL